MIHSSPDTAAPHTKPLMPTANKLLPYLRTIDNNRYYSNRGPLVLRLEERMEALFRAPAASASSATAGLIAAIQALELPPASVIATPAWTFAATPAAIVAAGHIPHFVDVDPTSHVITPGQFTSWPKPPAAVVPVMPFGAPTESGTEEWDIFTMQTGVPAVIDAAAAFDTCSHFTKATPGKTPVVISTHCTKPFGTGEGGLVFSTDKKFLNEVRERLNFGLTAARVPASFGTNGKMSEYHAAVGLAELDGWRRKREAWIERKQWYYAALGSAFTDADDFAQSTINVTVKSARHRVVSALRERGIETRTNMYGVSHTAGPYDGFPCDLLPVTQELIRTQMSLPFSVDMNEETIKHIVRSFKDIVACPDL